MQCVITKLIGGLGNQMFQYATGRALADRLGVPLKLDVSGFESYALRRFELDQFQIDATVASTADVTEICNGNPSSLSRRVMKWLSLAPGPTVLREQSFAYDPRIESAVAPVYLEGYWQSEKYFASVKARLRDQFVLRAAPDDANRRFAEMIASVPMPVSLHVRRGDYVSDAKTAQYHGALTLDYYRAAIAEIGSRVENPHFFLFSDDPAWVAAHLVRGANYTLVTANAADRGACDFALMKMCRHHIIANSSFSWWCAWLNPHQDRIVVAPRRWFSGADLDTKDLIPADWHTI